MMQAVDHRSCANCKHWERRARGTFGYCLVLRDRIKSHLCAEGTSSRTLPSEFCLEWKAKARR